MINTETIITLASEHVAGQTVTYADVHGKRRTLLIDEVIEPGLRYRVSETSESEPLRFNRTQRHALMRVISHKAAPIRRLARQHQEHAKCPRCSLPFVTQRLPGLAMPLRCQCQVQQIHRCAMCGVETFVASQQETRYTNVCRGCEAQVLADRERHG